MSGAGRTVVLGLGNILNRDEGLGVHALEPLRRRLGPSTGVEILDGGVLGLDLLPIVEAAGALLILDAVDARQPAGTIVDLRGDEIPLYGRAKLSLHQGTFQEVLQIASVRGRLPDRLRLLGIQPADVSVGLGLSAEVSAALPGLIDRAVEAMASWR